jgi:hypothetical protein
VIIHDPHPEGAGWRSVRKASGGAVRQRFARSISFGCLHAVSVSKGHARSEMRFWRG